MEESIQENEIILSEKEIERRRKISIASKKRFEERRKKGYALWLKKKQKEKAKKEKEKLKEQEKERAKKLKEKEEKKLKKKVGRPKKRGPKKKRKYISKKKKAVQPKKLLNYKIISCKNGKQNGYLGQFYTSEEAYEFIENLMVSNKNVIFPIDFEKDREPVYEYYILEKDRDGTKTAPLLRNEYGKLIEHVTTNSKWVIVDKFPYKIEEVFWVWGYHPIKDRKTFKWIFDNKILGNINGPYDILQIILYKNKIIIKTDEKMDIVFCKNMSNAIKFYNLLEEWAKKERLKQVFFMGSYNKLGERRKKLEQEIVKLTGWSIIKVQTSDTRKKGKNYGKNIL